MVHLLESLPGFRVLSETDLRLLMDAVEEVHLPPSTYLFRAGEPADGIYIVQSGTLHVLVMEAGVVQQLLATVTAGEVLGEMGVLYGQPRSATVRAVSDARLLKVPTAIMEELFARNAALRTQFLQIAQRRLPSLHLASVPMFAGLDSAALREFDLDSNWMRVTGGQTLFSQGDAPDYLYVVVRGRLEVVVAGENGEQKVVGHIGPGALVGEVAFLSGEPRTATVRTIRDSELVRVSQEALRRFLEHHPAGALEMLRGLARRIRPAAAAPRHALLSSIAVIPAGPQQLPLDWTARFADVLSSVGGPTLLVNRRRIDEHFHGDVSSLDDDLARWRVDQWVHDQADRFRYVVFECDATSSAWTELCLRQADLILIVATAGAEPRPSEMHTRLFGSLGARSATTELVLLHSEGTARPTGTARWLSVFPVTRHHHVRVDRVEDYRRVARFIAGTSISLAFSGGGARALGHIGVVKALRKSGVPVDAVAGVSAGCFAPAFYAMGHDHESTMAISHDSVGSYNPLREATIPIVSFLSGRKSVDMLRRMFDVEIEDLWIPFCCLSANLTRAALVIHDRGPLWRAVRASTSVPGVAPPVCVGGELLVDGGVLNNLPADVMRERYGGTVIAVDVSLAVDLKTDARELLSMSGWPMVWARFNPLAKKSDLPHIFEILTRTATLSSVHHGETIAKNADYYLRLPVEGVPTFDWKAGPALIDRCYEYAMQEIERWNIQERVQR
jgi:CRP-like cAMP-binding protein/predicted acylesterase/phospholipase RssA